MQGQWLDTSVVTQVKDRTDERCSGSVVFDHLCRRPVSDKIINRISFTGLHETEMTNAAFGEPDQTFSKRREMDPVSNRDAFAAAFVFARGHRLSGDKKIMQAAQTRKSDLMRGVEQILGSIEQI